MAWEQSLSEPQDSPSNNSTLPQLQYALLSPATILISNPLSIILMCMLPDSTNAKLHKAVKVDTIVIEKQWLKNILYSDSKVL